MKWCLGLVLNEFPSHSPHSQNQLYFCILATNALKYHLQKKKSFTITLKISNTYKQITNGMQDFNTENYKTLEKF